MTSLFAQRQFGYGTYTPDRLETGTPSVGATLPRTPKSPTEDPVENPTKPPTSDPNNASNSESRPNSNGLTNSRSTNNSLWNTATKVGANALGIGASAVTGLSRSAVSEASDVLNSGVGDLTRAVGDVPSELPALAKGVGTDVSNLGSQFANVAKSANSFLESTGNGGVVNAVQGKAPASEGLKVPDSLENVGTDLSDLFKGDFGLAA